MPQSRGRFLRDYDPPLEASTCAAHYRDPFTCRAAPLSSCSAAQLLYTLEFDVAVDHPYGEITSHIRKWWREDGIFGPRDVRVPELSMWDRAACDLAFDV